MVSRRRHSIKARALASLLPVLLPILLSACGSSGGSLLPMQPDRTDVQQQPAPAGVAPELWDELTRALHGELDRLQTRRNVSLAPLGEQSKVPDLAVQVDDGVATFTWSYRNLGDYDFNGETNPSDLTPLGVHFMAGQGDADWESAQVADGDENGEVNVADITPIALNFKATVTGYRLEYVANPTADFGPAVAEVLRETAERSGPWPRFEFALTTPQDRGWYRVVPYHLQDGAITEGIPSDPVQVVLNHESAPDPPVNLQASDGEFLDKVVLSWIEPAGADGYLVYRDGQTAELTEIGAATSWEDTTLPDSVPHTYWLRAFNAFGLSDFSSGDAGSLKYQGSTGSGQGDWWTLGHDRAHTCRSPYEGPITNHVLWAFETEDGVGSPAFGSDGAIYFSSQSGYVYALNQDATLRWRYDAGQDLCSDLSIDVDGTVYVGAYGTSRNHNLLLALNTDGTMKWTYQEEIKPGTHNEICTTPLIGPDGTLYIGDIIGRVLAIDSLGSLAWKFEIPGITFKWFYSSAAMDGGQIYIGCGDGNLYAFNLAGDVLWKEQTDLFVEAPPAVGPDGTVYIGSRDNCFYAVHPNGEEAWKYATEGEIYASPAIAEDGTVYIGSCDHNFYAFNPDGSLKWAFPTESYITGAAAVDAAGRIYFASYDKNLYALNPDGTELWRYELLGSPSSSLAIDERGILYVGAYGRLYAFGEGETPPPPDPPGWISASDGTEPDGIEITWQKMPGATHYRIYRDYLEIEGRPMQPVASVGDTDRWLDTRMVQLEDWAEHTYWVVAANPYGDSEFSAPDTGFRGRRPADDGPGDWNMYGREPKHQRRSPFAGPATNNNKWNKVIRGDSSDFVFTEPVIGSEGRIYVTCNWDWLIVFNADGSIHWKLKLGDLEMGNPTIGADGVIYLSGSSYSGTSYFFAINPSGDVEWTYALADGEFAWVPTLSEAGEIYVGSSDGALHALFPDGSLDWRFALDAAACGCPAIADDGSIYIGCEDGRMYAVTDGGEEHWRSEILLGTPGYPAIGKEGVIFVTTDAEQLYALTPEGAVSWKRHIDYSANYGRPLPVAIGSTGVIYIGSFDGLCAYDPDGSLRWLYPTSGQAVSPVVDANDNLYFSADPNGNVYALNPDGELIWSREFEYDVKWSFAPVIGGDGTLYDVRSTYLYAYGPED